MTHTPETSRNYFIGRSVALNLTVHLPWRQEYAYEAAAILRLMLDETNRPYTAALYVDGTRVWQIEKR